MRLPGSTQVLPADEGSQVVQRQNKKYRSPARNPWLKADFLAAAGSPAQQHAAHGSPAHAAEPAGKSQPTYPADPQPSSIMQGYPGHPNLAVWQSQHTDCAQPQLAQPSPRNSAGPAGEPFLAAHRPQHAGAQACSTPPQFALGAGSPGPVWSQPQQQPAAAHMPWRQQHLQQQQQQQQLLVQQQQDLQQLGQPSNGQHYHKVLSITQTEQQQQQQQQQQGASRPGQLHPTHNQDSSPPRRPRSANKMVRRS